MGQTSEYLKHLMIRTPLERPILHIRNSLGFFKRMKNPELIDIYLEAERLEEFMWKVLKKSSNCLDIGAHLGSMLSLILRIAPQGHHMAFEPVPQKAKWLRKKFPEVEVLEVALSDSEGEATFFVNPKATAVSTLQLKKDDRDGFTQIHVKQAPLDTIIPPDYRVDFIKMDVEGAEYLVIKGAQSILKRDKPILIFECTKTGLSDFGITPQEIYTLLTKTNYKIFLVKDYLNQGKALEKESFSDAMNYPFKAFNFLAIP